MQTYLNGEKLAHVCDIETDAKYHYITFGFNRELINIVKQFQGAKWLGYESPPRKAWRINNSPRNTFQLKALQGGNPYANYDRVMTPEYVSSIAYTRPLMSHQKFLTATGLFYKQTLWAAEMGTGKTLALIEVIEREYIRYLSEGCHPVGVWIVAPSSALASVRLECWKWNCTLPIDFMTYDELKRRLINWPAGTLPPRIVGFDESSRLKTEGTQRSEAGQHLGDSMRAAYGENFTLIEMSGSPAPGTPSDWWKQIEIICPGYFKAGDSKKFKYELGVFVKAANLTGQSFPKFKTWRNGNTTLCNVCGELANYSYHQKSIASKEDYHPFEPLKDEVSRLYKRMRGIVHVLFKKDCLDLPDKVYRTINITPTAEIMRAAKLVQASSPNTITALTRLRELSDGFQYTEKVSHENDCDSCDCNGIMTYQGVDDTGKTVAMTAQCMFCGGTRKIKVYERDTKVVASPKLTMLGELLEEEFEDANRLVIYAGFTGSIDLITWKLTSLGWSVIQVDGRGWQAFGNLNGQTDRLELLKLFQTPHLSGHEQKVCFVGHPGSAGMGLTLTASNTIIYYSNDFNFESRIQSEDRIHRAGMDVNRGANIIDLIHLKTDELVLKNLKVKKVLQAMSMGDVLSAMNSVA